MYLVEMEILAKESTCLAELSFVLLHGVLSPGFDTAEHLRGVAGAAHTILPTQPLIKGNETLCLGSAGAWRTTGILAGQYSQSSCLHAPQQEPPPAVEHTRKRKRLTPSLRALKRATRSAQQVRP